MPSTHYARIALLSLLGAIGVLFVACQPAPSPTPAPTKPPAAAVVPSPSPSPAAVASPSPSPSPNPVTTGSEVVAAPSGATVRITAPTANASVPAGNVRVTYDVTGATLVAAAEARRVEDLHIHVLLDVDPAPYLGTTTFIPLNVPNIIHTAAREATFNNVPAGQHRVTIILTAANHISVRPPVSDTVTFTVQ